MTLALVGALGERAEAAPEYCNLSGIRMIIGDVRSAQREDPRDALPAIIAMSCERRAPEVEGARAKWSKALELTDAEWNEVAQWAVKSAGERNNRTIAQADKVAWSALSPMEQYALLASHDDPHYVADALTLTETGRFGYVMACLGSRKPVDWALCQPDIDVLDTKRVRAEIRADKRDGVAKTILRIALHELPTRIDERKQAFAKLTDPAYPKLFALAADARKSYRADAELRALAAAMDDARVTQSNKAYEGCEQKTWEGSARRSRR